MDVVECDDKGEVDTNVDNDEDADENDKGEDDGENTNGDGVKNDLGEGEKMDDGEGADFSSLAMVLLLQIWLSCIKLKKCNFS